MYDFHQNTLLRLAPDIRLLVEEEIFYLVGENALLELPDEVGQFVATLYSLERGFSIDYILEKIHPSIALELLKNLFELRWLHFVSEEDYSVPERYLQVMRWLANVTTNPGKSLHRMRGARVAILGVGGLGIQVLEHLIGLGLESAVLIDADVVELHNLNRQYGYTPEDVGRPKVIVAAEIFRRQVPSADLHTFVQHVCSEENLTDLDMLNISILVNCADQPENLESIVNQYASARGLATISAGVGIQRGYWGPLHRAGTIFSNQISSHVTIGQHKVEKFRCTSSHGPYNSIVAAFLAHDVFSFVTGCMVPRSLGGRMTIDFETMRVGIADRGL